MKVEPIKSKQKIRLIKKLLNDNPRNLLLFTVGLNTGLRMGDILKLRVNQVVNKNIGDRITITEGKTGKENYFIINNEIYRVLTIYLETLSPDTEWLFSSRKGDKPILVESVNHLIKKWCNDVGLNGNYGCHSLRKSFGYFHHKNGVSLPVLMERFNHSSQQITLRYIGITPKDIDNLLMNDI